MGDRSRISIGDALRVLKTLPDNSLHMCATSPPYLGAREYGPRAWFDEDPNCEHDKSIVHGPRHPGALEHTLSSGKGTGVAGGHTAITHSCSKCGAWYGQLGLEPTIDRYVQHLTLIFREVRRVVRRDGTCWLNIADGYAYNGECGVPRKNLMGVPWRVALALQEDGWNLRSSNIWVKSSTLPESVQDRPTKSHEYVFLLSKSDRYFYDGAAVSEEAVTAGFTRRNKRDVWHINPRPFKGAHFAVFPPELPETCIKAGTSEHGCCATCGRPLGRGRPCTCSPKPPVPAIVLDPFAGSGTTLMVARQLGRDFIGIEQNKDYVPMILGRVASVTKPPLVVLPHVVERRAPLAIVQLGDLGVLDAEYVVEFAVWHEQRPDDSRLAKFVEASVKLVDNMTTTVKTEQARRIIRDHVNAGARKALADHASLRS